MPYLLDTWNKLRPVGSENGELKFLQKCNKDGYVKSFWQCGQTKITDWCMRLQNLAEAFTGHTFSKRGQKHYTSSEGIWCMLPKCTWVE